MEERSIKERWEDFKYDCKLNFVKFSDWCHDHKEVLVVIVPVLVSGSIELVKIAAKSKNVGEEKRLKDNYIYDRSLGHYYELSRKPTASEWRMIDHRKQNGELLGDVLNDMRILK